MQAMETPDGIKSEFCHNVQDRSTQTGQNYETQKPSKVVLCSS